MNYGMHNMEIITSKDNKKVKHCIQLYKRKYRSKEKQFVAEGYRTVLDMIPTGQVLYIMVNIDAMQEEQLHIVKEQAETYDIPLYGLSTDVFKHMESTINGQGIVAIVCQKIQELKDFRPTEDGLYLLLDTIQDPGNMGTIIRTAVGAGVKGIFLSHGCVDVYNEKTVRSTMSGLSKIPIYENLSLDDIKRLKQSHSITWYGAHIKDAVEYGIPQYEGSTMIVLGNEGNGISEALLNLLEQRIMIPLYGPMESLNVAVAGALCMYKVQEKKLYLSKRQ